MIAYVDGFLEFIGTLPDPLVYGCLALSAFVENVFPPIPGDTITAFGAFLVGTGRLRFSGVFLSTVAGSLCGFMVLFRVGGLLGRRFFIVKDYRFFKASDIIRAEEWFRKYGYYLILINRFLPGIRSAVAIVGGLLGLRTLTVSVLALFSISVWNLLWITLGYGLGSNWNTVRSRTDALMARYYVAIGVLFLLAVLALLGRWVFREYARRKRR